jgi:hypothetical protein
MLDIAEKHICTESELVARDEIELVTHRSSASLMATGIANHFDVSQLRQAISSHRALV